MSQGFLVQTLLKAVDISILEVSYSSRDRFTKDSTLEIIGTYVEE